MRIQSSPRSRFAFAAAAFVALAAGLASIGTPAASAGQTNIAYDELTRFIGGDKPAPQPGTFDADFQAAVAASSPAPQHHGMFGNLMNTVEQAKSAMNVFTVGNASHVYYYNGWKRVDEIATQTATIDRPDKHEIIYLDLAKKTYRIVDTNQTPVTETPPPYAPPPQPGAPPPSPEPGTGKLDISVSSTSLGAKSLEGINTSGFSQDFKMTESQSTGSCKDGSFETQMTEYLSSYPEPQEAVATTTSTTKMPSMPMMNPAMMSGQHPGCNPTITTHFAAGASPPSGRLAMWTLMALTGSAQTSSGRGGGTFSTLIERGNVRALGTSDAALFDVPAGFTQQ
jgi:hypothetical protein